MKRKNNLDASAKLLKASWRVVKTQKSMIWAPVLGALSIIGVYLGIWLVYILTINILFALGWDGRTDGEFNTSLIFLFGSLLICFIIYGVANYYAGVVAWMALKRFDGQTIGLKEGIKQARKRAGALWLFALVQAVFGKLLQLVSDNVPLGGKIVCALTGVVWSVATMFTIPVIMDGKSNNPFVNIKKSTDIFRKIWKESIYVGIGLSGIAVLVGVIIFVMIAGGSIMFEMVSPVIGGVFIAGGVIATLISVVALSVLESVAMAAAYYYAMTGKAPAGFDKELIRSMFHPKKKWFIA